jgi:hypothetical protein
VSFVELEPCQTRPKKVAMQLDVTSWNR